MTRRILVPLDGTPETEAILPEVRRLADPSGEVTLLHVLPLPTPPVGMEPTRHLALPEQVAPYLLEVRQRAGSPKGLDLVRAGDPADAILQVALEFNIDAIALCTHGRKGIARWFLGSVAEGVLRKTGLPVILTRPNVPAPAHEVRRILVPLDGSEASLSVLNTVKPLARRLDAEVILLHVATRVHDPAPQWAFKGPIAERSEPQHRFQEIADGLENAGLYAWPVVVRGDPVKEILHEARAQEADLIAMATHAREGVERAVLGSVAEGALRGAGCAVLLQRPVAWEKGGLFHD